MKRVYETPLLPDAVIVRDMLDANGIEARVVGGETTHVFAETAAVWVVSNDDRERARTLIREFEHSKQTDAQAQWSCRGCREMNPGEFQVCWSCGAARRQ